MKYPVRGKKLIRLKFQACILLHVKSLILSQNEKKNSTDSRDGNIVADYSTDQGSILTTSAFV